MRLLALALLIACSAPASRTERPAPSTAHNTLDPDLYPMLGDALRAQKPHLISSRGGRELVLVVNGGPAESLSNLSNIPTAWVLKVERVLFDYTLPGNVSSLRVTLRSR